jgi:hypothetical protein
MKISRYVNNERSKSRECVPSEVIEEEAVYRGWLLVVCGVGEKRNKKVVAEAAQPRGGKHKKTHKGQRGRQVGPLWQ